MYIITDENGFILTVSWGAFLDGGFEVEDFEFTEDMRAYQYVDGKIVLNQERLEQLQQELVADEEIHALQTFLDETQAVVTQAFEDEILGIQSDETEIIEIVKQRHAAKAKIAKLQEVTSHGKGS